MKLKSITRKNSLLKMSSLGMKKGFALISTISIMMLLLMVALGMLSLSSVEQKANQGGSALEEAKANARIALMMAVGELQKSMGPDRRISATSELYGTDTTPVTKPNLTGVWESWWDFDPSADPDYVSEKTSRFRRWLVSGADATVGTSQDPESFINTPWDGRTVELVGVATMGDGLTDADRVTAGLVSVTKGGEVKGSYAWHVSDESVKARINLYRDPRLNVTLADKRALLAGHRPDFSVLKDAGGEFLDVFPTDRVQADYLIADGTIGKVLDLDQAELLDRAEGKIKPFRHDITPYSLGVMTDVRRGTLKQDLSSMFEMGAATTSTLPTEFKDQKLYDSTHGITGISDPNWSSLAGYYNSFRDLTTPDTKPTYAVKSSDDFTDPVSTGFNPAPVITKVDTIFSLVGRPLEDIWWVYGGAREGSAGETYDQFVNFIFTPVVTLHNPYNVNISFNRMDVTFTNIPVGFNFMFKSGKGGGFVSKSVVPGTFDSINTMAYRGHTDFDGNQSRNNKSFVLNIANWQTNDRLSSNSSIDGPITLKPGQTLICGPAFDPNASFKSDAGKGVNTVGFDWKNALTNSIKAKPNYVPGLGYEIYATAISNFRLSGAAGRVKPDDGRFYYGGWRGHPFMMLRDSGSNPHNSKSNDTDEFYMEYKVQRPGWYTDDSTNTPTLATPTFAVTAKIQATSSSALVDYAKLQFDYGDDSNISSLFDDRVYRYPPTGSLRGSEIAAPSGIPYGSQSAFVRPFAIFSAYARTTNGGVYETGKRAKTAINSPEVNLLRDGRLAGKPFLYHNPSRSNFVADLTREKPGVQSYELNFQPFVSNGDFEGYMDVDVTNRVPALSGNKTTSGIKSGSYLEIPSGPMQTIADFRRSNALTTAYLPHFVQPVGNSLLHPLMTSDKVTESNSSVSTSELMDHSVLANHALYDRFYFSTFATRESATLDTVFEQFMNGTAPLSLQSFQPYLPAGKDVQTAKTDLYSGTAEPSETAYKHAAEYQMIRGAFNVNSTSVQAWKAMLASMNKNYLVKLWARNAELEITLVEGTPVLPMTLVNGGAVKDPNMDPAKIDNERSNDWNGYRVLNEMELELLATKIVAEVRERGPFLSMSEFVNRQVGPEGPLTLSGALEAAITKSEINEAEGAVSPDTYLDQTPITQDDVDDPKLYAYKTLAATTGNPAAGAPGWVNQGDLMRILEPSATVRGDTFVVRVYGEAQDANGKITATAYAEAVVQRVPDYVDSSDRPSLNASSTDSTAKEVNQKFGRRMQVVSFRWLSDKEI